VNYKFLIKKRVTPLIPPLVRGDARLDNAGQAESRGYSRMELINER
jgi:hypothetical protein